MHCAPCLVKLNAIEIVAAWRGARLSQFPRSDAALLTSCAVILARDESVGLSSRALPRCSALITMRTHWRFVIRVVIIWCPVVVPLSPLVM